jgi:voltage-gated potassium channel
MPSAFYGLVDLLAIVPGILAIYYSDAQYLLIIRIIRMLRIFRVLKLAPYLSQANYLLSALRGSKQKIIVFLVSVSTLVTVFGTLMYVVEGPGKRLYQHPGEYLLGHRDPDHGGLWRHRAQDPVRAR